MIKVGNAFFDLRTVKHWVKLGRVVRLPGQLKWIFAELPPDAHKAMLIENLSVRIGNNVAGMISEQWDALASMPAESRRGAIWDACVKRVLEEMNTRGTPFEAVLANMDFQE